MSLQCGQLATPSCHCNEDKITVVYRISACLCKGVQVRIPGHAKFQKSPQALTIAPFQTPASSANFLLVNGTLCKRP